MNDRQKKFVREYIKRNNATQAAIAAGYSKKTARSIGQRLLTNIDIQNAIEKQQLKLQEEFKYSVEESFENLKKAQELALEREIYGKPAPDLSNFIKAEELKGKLKGLYVEKKEISGGLDISPFKIDVVK